MNKPSLSHWSIHHPIGTLMLSAAILVLGAISFKQLPIDLLPKLIYPNINVRVLDPGVPASVMEDRITRQLEEQLAITEGVVHIQSSTREGRSAVNLSFDYDTDIDIALRDASTRLDRAKRFLPTRIDAPIIYKRDPSQRPIVEYVVSAPLRDPSQLRDFVEHKLAKWFITLPGIASTEVGGGSQRQILITPYPERLRALGLSLEALQQRLEQANHEQSAGRYYGDQRELASRTGARFENLDQIRQLPIEIPANRSKAGQQPSQPAPSHVPLEQLAEVIDGQQQQRLFIRANGVPGIKLSIQKQPQANTVDAAHRVAQRLDWLIQQGLIPEDIQVTLISDQAHFIHQALNNAWSAALGGAVLAMLVVWLFLGDLRRTLIIGSAIPLAVAASFILMAAFGLSLNVMTLGGLALGTGLLVDASIVMMENMQRDRSLSDSSRSAAQVHSAIIASTSTNLAALLPFLLISGLIGLLFSSLLITIASAVCAAMLVALSLVPALVAQIRPATDQPHKLRRLIQTIGEHVRQAYLGLLETSLKAAWLLPVIALAASAYAGYGLLQAKQQFLPKLDKGEATIYLRGDPGMALADMDQAVEKIEQLLANDPLVTSVYSSVGGFIYGRSQFESSNRSSIQVRLIESQQRPISSAEWVQRTRKHIKQLNLVGFQIHLRAAQLRGIRLSRGDDDISLRIRGDDLDTLATLGDQVVEKLQDLPGLRNLQHSLEASAQELVIKPKRQRLASLGLSEQGLAQQLQRLLEGQIVGDFQDGDRAYPIRLRLARSHTRNLEQLAQIPLSIDTQTGQSQPVQLSDVASLQIQAAPASIDRDQQQRMVEISASLAKDTSLFEAAEQTHNALKSLHLPAGYSLYDGDAVDKAKAAQQRLHWVLSLAVFLVFVVMAVQYESLRNPSIILLTAPGALIGVWIGLEQQQLPVSMPVWLGLIILTGIVVNNAIVLIEFIEQQRQLGQDKRLAVITAAGQRLRPILMTSLTTIGGLLPLSLALTEGAKMLQPMAVTLVWGLALSLFISLLVTPALYLSLGRNDDKTRPDPTHS